MNESFNVSIPYLQIVSVSFASLAISNELYLLKVCFLFLITLCEALDKDQRL